MVLLWALLGTGAWAEARLPELAPEVRSLVPLGGRAGEGGEVRFFGRNLEGVTEIRFARPDIRAEVLGSDFFSVSARVEVGAKVPIGLHDFRLRTAMGTCVGVFDVGRLPEVKEREPNNDAAHAQALALPAVVDGIVEQGDYDVFRFHAEAGRTLIFDVVATRAHSRLDATLAVLDERGNELDFNDDYYIHKDPHLEFAVPRTGDYLVRVAGSQERGSAQSSYRLIAGELPHLLRVLPLGAQRGVAGEFRVAGLNLKGIDRVVLGDAVAVGQVVAASTGEFRFRMTVPATAAPGRYALHAWAGGLEAPLPVAMLVSDLPERLAEKARERAAPQAIAVPVALSGVLEKRRAADFFAFEAQAGERLAFEVDAMKLGYLIDPVVAVYTPDGRLVASDDDRLQQNGAQPPNLDPYLVHTFEKAGRYVAMIRDTAQRGDPNYVYRLSVYRPQVDVDLKALTPAVTLFRGHTGMLPVRVRRLGGWNTPVEVQAVKLPAGLASRPQTAQPKDTIVKDNCALERKLDGTNVDLPIRVAADARPGTYAIDVRVRGMLDGKAVEHGPEIQYEWESVGKVSGATEDQKLLVTVSDLPPVVLKPPESLSLTPGKAARMRVLVSRYDGAATPLKLEPEPAPAGIEFENTVLPAGAGQVELRVTASSEGKAGRIRLRAGTALSPPIELKLGHPEEDR